ncbi:Six-hairpin glycosidase-like protein [Helicostylum pulchrum]|nr:Six-hairpin glycosidase-like protein [Helicostylum pulchrum]
MLLIKLTCLLFTSVVIAQQIENDVNPHYAKLLNHSMLFYEAQRSGRLPETNRIPWRSDSALTDGQDNNISLSEGYFDAGNYLKFTVPLSYTLTMLSWGGIEWIESYKQANLMTDLRDSIKWGTDWIIKAHPEPNVLFVQVGDGKVDNMYWGPDTGIPLPRPSFMINSSSPGTDAAALASAALSSASYLFRNQFNDTEYADTLLSHAYDLLTFAETAKPWRAYSVSVPAAVDYYNTNTFQSQLIYGNMWLYKATENVTYLERANAHYDAFNSTLVYGVMDWSDPTGAMLILGATLDADKYQARAMRYLDTVLDTTQNSSICKYTDGGLFYCKGYSTSNSVMPPLNMGFLVAIMKKAFPNLLNGSYTSFIQRQIDYILGANKMFSPYVCGIHKNSPHNPHHAGASGGTNLKKINSEPKHMAHVLYGAIVGGPDDQDNFYDIRNDYLQTEVAIDYNAPFQSLMAYQISIQAADPPYVTITEDRPVLIPEDVKFEGWKIAVIVVSIVFAILVVGFVIYWRKQNQKKKNANDTLFEKVEVVAAAKR